jgi:hypothetical protein
VETIFVDSGYRGRSRCGETEVLTPKPPKKTDTVHARRKAKAQFRRRAAIEPRIGHLKSDHRLGRNFLKGQRGDAINLLLASLLQPEPLHEENFLGSSLRPENLGEKSFLPHRARFAMGF